MPMHNKEHLVSLFQDTLVWDAHAGIFPGPDTDLGNIGEWKDAGVDYISINVGFDILDWANTIATLSNYRRQLSSMSDRVALIAKYSDIESAFAQKKLAVSFDIEGVNALNGDLGMVSLYYDLGVRQMLFAYNLNNAGCGGCHDNDSGLTAFGRDVVSEMNRLGMTIDMSHIGYRSSLDIMEASEKPVAFTHSNPRALWDHQRNIQDEQIRQCAQTGGVIGINGLGIFLGDNTVSEEVFADHVCHIADLVGPQHVGVGLDWKPKTDNTPDIGAILRSRPDFWPVGQQYDTKKIKMFSPAQLFDVVAILHSRGWSDADLKGFLGGNFLRVIKQVWK
jgi:membrane dipeptidase